MTLPVLFLVKGEEIMEKKGFDSAKFERQEFHARTEDVKLDVMTPFFPEGEEPIFKIRSLSADEVARTNDVIKTAQLAEGMLEALLTHNKADIAKELKNQLGYGSDVNPDIQRRIELIIYGTVKPQLPRELIVKMAENLPTAFYKLSNRITDITGLGNELGKQPPSGETTESKQP